MADDKLIREYLIGNLSENDERRVEEQLFTDKAFYDEMGMAEDELVDDYVRGSLSESELQGFRTRFLSTPERHQKLKFAKALNRRLSTTNVSDVAIKARAAPPIHWTSSVFTHPLRLAATILFIVGLGLGIWRVFFYQSDVEKGLTALRGAYRNQRPLEARISGFEYAPYTTQRGGEKDILDYLSRDRAERILLDAVFEQPGSASHHALGKFYLAAKNYDKAIDQFEEALKADDRNATLHADLGAALLEKGKADRFKEEPGKSLEGFAKSLEHLNKALQLNPALLDALFNRALLHQEMALPEQAREDWQRYLQRDPSSSWANEARQHLNSLEEQKKKTSRTREELFDDFLTAFRASDEEGAWRIVSQSYGRTGNVVADQLTDAFLDASGKKDGDQASVNLEILSYIGELEVQRGDDHLITDLASIYRRANSSQRLLLAQARRLMRSGHERYAQFKLEETVDLYNKAKRMFDEVGDTVESGIAEYWLGHCYLRKHDDHEALSTFDQLAHYCELNKYKRLLVRALYGLSAGYFNLNEYSQAIRCSHRSLDLAEQLDDPGGKLNSTSALVEYLRYLGSYSQCLGSIQRSFPLPNPVASAPVQIWRHYAIVASSFASMGLYAAAAAYQREAVRIVHGLPDASTLSVSYANLALLQAKSGDHGEAVRNAQLSYDIAKAHSKEPSGQGIVAYSALQMANVYREAADFAQARAKYDESIDLYGQLAFSTHIFQAHKGRLICYLAQGDRDRVRQEIEAALGLLEQYRSEILEEDRRNNFFDIEQSVYDLAIEFEFSRMRDPEKAFEYSEASKARSLLNLIDSYTGRRPGGNKPEPIPVSSPLNLRAIQDQLSDRVQILQYAVLKDRLLIWLLSKTGIVATEEVISENELRQKSIDYLKCVSRPSAGEEQKRWSTGKELFDLLIGPIASSLDRNKVICIVPDKTLSYLPFAALVSQTSPKYLIEDYALLISPSSSVFVLCSDVALKKPRVPSETLLSVGNPRFDRTAFPGLMNLPSAETEARAVAALYNPNCILLGETANPVKVKMGMEKSDVVHLALHSLIDEQSQIRSGLVLAKGSKSSHAQQASDAILHAQQIWGMRLPRTRLVALSACQTAAERYYRGEGMISIARPFIAAGVPLVVASLWPVDSDFSTELMISFHKYRKVENLSTIEALRHAQIDVIKKPELRFREPYYWASFVVIGGYAEF